MPFSFVSDSCQCELVFGNLGASQTTQICYYHSQIKFAKLCCFHGCLSVHGGEGGSVQGDAAQEGLCPGGPCPGVSVWGVSAKGISVQGDLCPGGSLSRGSLSWIPSVTVTCVRYASYWNALLVRLCIHSQQLVQKSEPEEMKSSLSLKIQNCKPILSSIFL